jgi:F-box protein 11
MKRGLQAAGKRLSSSLGKDYFFSMHRSVEPNQTASAPPPESADPGSIEAGQCKAERLTSRIEPRIWVVDAEPNRGDFQTLADAIQAASPGHRILVRPGCYHEGLRLEKPLEIIGDGKPEDIVVEAAGQDVIFFNTNFGRVAGLTLRQAGGGQFYAVDICQGRLELEGCDIASQSLACVAIHGNAEPVIRHNRIHDGQSNGVLVYESGRGTLEDNDIFGHGLSGVEIIEAGHPILRANRIHGGRGAGVFVHQNGRGLLEDNEIHDGATVGVAIQGRGDPLLRRNRIHSHHQSGVLIYEQGKGTLEDNEIVGNASAGVMIRTGGSPEVRRNAINYNSQYGVMVGENCGGHFVTNNLTGNNPGPWYVHDSSQARIKVVGNIE